MAATLARAVPPLRQGAGVGVVLQVAGQAQPPLHMGAKGRVFPPGQVGRRKQHAAPAIQRSSAADAHAAGPPPLGPGWSRSAASSSSSSMPFHPGASPVAKACLPSTRPWASPNTTAHLVPPMSQSQKPLLRLHEARTSPSKGPSPSPFLPSAAPCPSRWRDRPAGAQSAQSKGSGKARILSTQRSIVSSSKGGNPLM